MLPLPPLSLDLVCGPPTRGEIWIGEVLSELEDRVGVPLRLEVGTDARCRPARDRTTLLGPLLFGGGLPDDRLVLVESDQQSFIAFLSGRTHRDACPDEGQDAVFKSFSVSALLPIDLPVHPGMELLQRLSKVGPAHVASLGSYVHEQWRSGCYPLPGLWPEEARLAWLNGWSAAMAARLGFPMQEDRERFWRIAPCPETGGVFCALTETRLDLARPDHAKVYAWAAKRFGVKIPS